MILYGELLAPRPTLKLEDHTLSAVRDCLVVIFAATLRFWRPFLHPQPEDAPCRGDRSPDSYYYLYHSTNYLISSFLHRNKYFCIQISKIRHTGENEFKFGFEMNIFLSLQEVSKLDWSATDFGSQFPEEFGESVTRLTTFCSFSWTLSMIQHPVMSVIRYSGGLPQRTHGCSELFQPVADRHKPDLRRWSLTSESQPLYFRRSVLQLLSCRELLFVSWYILSCWSHLPCSLWYRTVAARLLGLRVEIPPGAWMFVSCGCCVLSRTGVCDGPITRSGESYRVWVCLTKCDHLLHLQCFDGKELKKKERKKQTNKCKKDNVRPRTGYENPGGSRGIALLFL
jgi:hypothetical protein